MQRKKLCCLLVINISAFFLQALLVLIRGNVYFYNNKLENIVFFAIVVLLLMQSITAIALILTALKTRSKLYGMARRIIYGLVLIVAVVTSTVSFISIDNNTLVTIINPTIVTKDYNNNTITVSQSEWITYVVLCTPTELKLISEDGHYKIILFETSNYQDVDGILRLLE